MCNELRMLLSCYEARAQPSAPVWACTHPERRRNGPANNRAAGKAPLTEQGTDSGTRSSRSPPTAAASLTEQGTGRVSTMTCESAPPSSGPNPSMRPGSPTSTACSTSQRQKGRTRNAPGSRHTSPQNRCCRPVTRAAARRGPHDPLTRNPPGSGTYRTMTTVPLLTHRLAYSNA